MAFRLHSKSGSVLLALLALLTSSGLGTSAAQTSASHTSLPEQVRQIAQGAQGEVSAACELPGTALNCDLHPHAHPPMQSVFKLPLALLVLQQVEQGKFALDQPIPFASTDRILPETWSPLQQKYPAGNVEVPLRELLRLTVSLSDNVAADILLRIAGGPEAVDQAMAALHIHGLLVQDNEAVLARDSNAQFRNWFEPAAAVQLLRQLADRSPLSATDTQLLLDWMASSTRTRRLSADLPATVRVAHKSGTSGMEHGVAAATNDIALIQLPDGRQLAVAVFLTNSRADDAARDQTIARIGKAAYDDAVRLTSARP